MTNDSETPSPLTLIVDDDVGFCSALRDAFRRRGLRALVAHGHAEAIEEAKAWEPARAVVDLRMPPGPNGLRTIEELLKQLPELEIVVLTGYGNIETAVAAIKLGARNYLTKPAEVADILAAFEVEPTAALDVEATTKSLEEVEREHTRAVLEQTGGNISEAARRLGINRRTLQRRLARDNDGEPS